MPRIDFVTAFGRLLRDAPLRDAYARDPVGTVNSLGVRTEDRPALLALDQADLSFQAEVLLLKRFDAVSHLIPETIANVGAHAWCIFSGYARDVWPTGELPQLDEARGFCAYLATLNNARVCLHERNRVTFATGETRFAIHLVPDVLVNKRRRYCLQILIRPTERAWREILFYIG